MFFWHMIGNRFLTFGHKRALQHDPVRYGYLYKAFTREVANKLHLRARGWGFDPEITAQILPSGYRIYEVPIFTGKWSFTEGKKISWRDGFTVLGRCSSTASRAIADTTPVIDEVAGTAMRTGCEPPMALASFVGAWPL